MLHISKYYRLPVAIRIPEIAQRLAQVLETGDAWPIELAPPIDIDKIEALRYKPSPHQPLPNREFYERELGFPLDGIRVRLGEVEPMRLLGEPWFVLGHTIFFASVNPEPETIRAALALWRRQQEG